MTSGWSRALYQASIIIITLRMHGLKERINLCVFSLSFIDMVYMTQAFLRHCDKLYWLFRDLLGHETPSIAIAEKFVFENKLIGLTGFSWASQYLSAIIACERMFVYKVIPEA
nr:hypothetical protein BaRGS_004313 [Batillaria attramentaria]